MTRNNQYNIFFSYVEDDSSIVQKIIEKIEDRGFSIWYYERDSIPGPSYLIQTAQQIEKADFFLILISNNSIKSHQVTAELEHAFEQKKNIVPLLYNISHSEFQLLKLDWRQMIGTRTSIQIYEESLNFIVERIIIGMKLLISDKPLISEQKKIQNYDLKIYFELSELECTIINLLLEKEEGLSFQEIIDVDPELWKEKTNLIENSLQNLEKLTLLTLDPTSNRYHTSNDTIQSVLNDQFKESNNVEFDKKLELKQEGSIIPEIFRTQLNEFRNSIRISIPIPLESLKTLQRNSIFCNKYFVHPYLKETDYELFQVQKEEKIINCNILLENFLDDSKTIGKDMDFCYFFLIGEAGIGKSTLLEYFEYSTFSNYKKIPLLIKISYFKDTDLTIRNFFDKLLFHCSQLLPQITSEEFEQYLKEHKVIVFLDGLDEYASRNADLNAVSAWDSLLKDFINIYNAKVMISSRPTVLSSKTIYESCGKLFELQIWNKFLIKEWLKKNAKEINPKISDTVDDIEIKLEKIYPLVELSQNPFLLKSIIEIYDKITQEDYISRIRIYREIINKKMKENFKRISPDLRFTPSFFRKLLQILALTFLGSELKLDLNFIDFNDYNFLTENEKTKIIYLINQTDKNNQTNILKFYLQNNSLLEMGEADEGFLFAHQTLAEFLLADTVIEELRVRQDPEEKLQFFYPRFFTIEALNFLFEILEESNLNLFDESDIKEFLNFKCDKTLTHLLLDWAKTHLKKDALNEIISSLTHQEDLDLSFLDLQSIPNLIDLKNTIYLDLSNNSLTNIPNVFNHFKHLEILKLSYNNFESFPEDFIFPSSLKVLKIDSNKLIPFPPNIDQLDKLIQLNLSGNRIEFIPEEILNNLKSLKVLIMSENKLGEIPEGINLLHSLTYLDLGDNLLKKIPTTFTALEKLQYLNLHKNLLEKLPEDIGKLFNLEKLFVEKNEIKLLPESIGKLTKLTIFHVYKNNLSVLPDSICRIKALETLGLYKNHLKNLPDEFGKLKNLKIIFLGENKLIKLPESIGDLEHLVFLNLKENMLEELPESIGKLEKLEEMSLYENNLKKLPETIKNLSSLKTIALWGNKLRELPKGLGYLSNLRTLEITDNKISFFPDSFINLINLQRLTMENNPFGTFPPKIKRWLNILRRRGCLISESNPELEELHY